MNTDIWITRFACAIIVIGIFCIFQSYILYFLKTVLWPVKNMQRKDGSIEKHLRQIFMVITNGKHLKEKMLFFIFLSLGILAIMGVILYKAFGTSGIFIALIMSAMPYGYIRARLMIKQVTGSFEGEMLLDELINQYKICHCNIYNAIDLCVLSLNDTSLSKKALFQLAIKLHSYSGEKELREALNDFVANWNTVWSRMLADNIYNAVKEEINVLHGLENILSECKQINEFIEENKKDGIETEVIVKIICPLFFIVLLWMAKNMMGYSWQTIFTYEFLETRGLIIFTSLVFITGLNIIVFPVLGKQKYDF